jgi:hypothetical protein
MYKLFSELTWEHVTIAVIIVSCMWFKLLFNSLFILVVHCKGLSVAFISLCAYFPIILKINNLININYLIKSEMGLNA